MKKVESPLVSRMSAFCALIVLLFLVFCPALRAETLIARSTAWKYLKGTREASEPRSEWRQPDFDDSAWSSGGAPIGFGEAGINTTLSDMLNKYSSFFVRKTFTASTLDAETRLRAFVDYDDGFIVWINGEKVLDRTEPDGEPLHDSVASGPHESGTFEEYELPDPEGYLEPGENVIAVQVFNASLGSGDCKFDLELSSFKRVADTQFSHPRGFYDAAFWVTITTATPGATIKYTLDGSDPRNSATANIYSAAQKIWSFASGPRNERFVNGEYPPCVVLRACAAKGGYEPTNVDTLTYVFPENVKNQQNLMNGEDWAVVAMDDATLAPDKMNTEMDPALIGKADYASALVPALRAVPTLSLVMPYSDLFGNSHGIYHNTFYTTWERAASMEMINADGSTAFQIDCGAQISGAGSRHPQNPKNSFNVKFRSQYGDGKLDYPLFGNTWLDKFDGLRIRAGANDSIHFAARRGMYIRDHFGRDTMRDMGWEACPDGILVHLYLNGMYWGVYNVAELPDENFAADYYGGEDDDYDLIANTRWHQILDAPVNTILREGTLDAWNAMMGIGTCDSLTKWDQWNGYLDMARFVDYLIMEIHCANNDWPGNNWRFARNRVLPGSKFEVFPWDVEHSMTFLSTMSTDKSSLGTSAGPALVHERLRTYLEYKTLFSDRVHRHLFNGGALDTATATGRWTEFADRFEPVVVCESARWGDASAFRYTSDSTDRLARAVEKSDWLAEKNRMLAEWFPGRNASVLSQFRARGLYPTLTPPAFNRHGGAIAAGFKLTLSNPNTSGALYYTLDGTDPRNRGGALAAGAKSYAGAITLSKTTHVRARIYKTNATWSAAHDAIFNFTAHHSRVRITEIMYNPLGGSEYEFIEVKNTGSSTRGLSGMTLKGVRYTFPAGTDLAAGEMLVLAADAAAFQQRYGTAPFGQYGGRLDNGGERLTLQDSDGLTVMSVRYNDKAPWPKPADGDGHSLVIVNETAEPDDPANWRASNLIGGSPGYDDGEPYRVVINEALTHTDLPAVDAIELYNDGAAGVNIGGWYLSDTIVNYRKFRIPDGTLLAAGGYAVFDEHDFNTNTNDPACFALSSHGDELYLTKWDSKTNLQYLAQAKFGGAFNGVAFGRHVKSDGESDFAAQSTPNTLGAANAYPAVGPVVITELMYHPATGGDEFIELLNSSGSTVKLYDPAYPANIWQFDGAVEYTFPAGAEMPAGGYALVVATNAATFRSRYGIPASVQIFGPYAGRLDNGGESVKLWRPDTPDPEGVPRVLVDRVQYNDNAPWPENADGAGPSLERIAPALYGNDPANWASSANAGGTPGAANSGVLVGKTAGWKYHDRGEDLGTGWRAAAYDDGAWESGNAPLGYPAESVDTEVSYGDNPGAKQITTYFRTAFMIANPAAVTDLNLHAMYDDGFVAYLNGQEVARGAMPAGTVSYGTQASSHSPSSFEPFALVSHIGKLVQGVNVLAIEVHQADPTSSDVFLDAQLTHTAGAPPPTPPAAPSSLAAEALGSTEIRLAWHDNSSDESGFKIERSPDGSSWAQIATVGANATAYTNTGLAPNTAYSYRVRAYNAAGNSGYSNTAGATTMDDAQPPAAPSNLQAAALSSTEIRLTWHDNSSDETGFRIQRSSDGVTFAPIAEPAANTTAYTDSGLAPGTTYTYKIKATGAAGGSDYSAVASATTASDTGTPELLAQAGWSLKSVSSYATSFNKYGQYVFDGWPGTLWESAGTGYPQEIQIDLGATYAVSGFRYLPRQEGAWGQIKDYEFYVSTDGTTWGAAVATGAFASGLTEKAVSFTAKTGRYIRLRALSPLTASHQTASIAELNVVGYPTSQNNPPLVAVTQPRRRQPLEYIYAPASVTIKAMASAKGAIGVARVEFYKDGQLLGQDTSAPYSYDWTGVAAGTYTLTAKAVYTDASQATSPGVAYDVRSSANGTPMSRSGWTLKYVDSWKSDTDIGAAPGEKTFDGVPFTWWVTLWDGPDPAYPHEIQIDLGGVHNIGGFLHMPALDPGPWGAMKQYEFYVSNDGTSWGAPVATGLWTYAADAYGNTYYQDEHEVNVTPVAGRYVRLRALAGYDADNGVLRVAEINVKTVGAVPPTLPPSNLAAAALSSSQIRLTWTDNSDNETGFRIQRSLDGVTYTTLTEPAANVTTYTDSGLTADTTYSYKIKARGLDGGSDYVGPASARTLAEQGGPATPPSGLTATALSATEIRLAWNDNSDNETGFKIRYSLDGVDFYATPSITVNPDVSVYTHAGLTPETTYYYLVKATDETGGSDYSNTAQATTPAQSTAPTGTLWAAYNDLNWTSGQPTANITRYAGWAVNGLATSGELVNHASGAGLGVTLAVNAAGSYSASFDTQGADPQAGTDAADVFGGIVGCQGLISGGDVTLVFDGLPVTNRYELTLYGNRAESSYTARTAIYTLDDVAGFTNTSSAGTTIGTTGMAGDTTECASGYNTQSGLVVQWSGVNPGSDGDIRVTVSSATGGRYVNAVRLRAVPGPTSADEPVVGVERGAVWKYRKGTAEAADPATAWRAPGFDDSGWAAGPAPFGYSSDTSEGPFGTTLDDARYGYTCLFLRRAFVVADAARVNALNLSATYDDGFIAWINGEEVARVNVTGEAGSFVAHDTIAPPGSIEPILFSASLGGGDIPALRDGTNVIAVQVFNYLASSSDFVFDLGLTTVRNGLPAADDADQDGMPDAWEVAQLDGTAQPADGDSDGDGFSNLAEYIAGTAADDDAQYFGVALASVGGQLVVSFTTIEATGAAYTGKTRHYRLEQLVDPDAGLWLAVTGYENIVGTGQVVRYTDTSGATTRQYRAKVWLE
ncbi:MAG: lamin tail domain-containing protein [Kiritimatiellae bacterium]|nr:lamin tail domain-containing protein [Kiritimatiellia bacterium]